MKAKTFFFSGKTFAIKRTVLNECLFILIIEMEFKMRYLMILLLALMGICFTACHDDKPCSRNSDCSSDEYCDIDDDFGDGYCEPKVCRDRECGGGYCDENKRSTGYCDCYDDYIWDKSVKLCVRTIEIELCDDGGYRTKRYDSDHWSSCQGSCTDGESRIVHKTCQRSQSDVLLEGDQRQICENGHWEVSGTCLDKYNDKVVYQNGDIQFNHKHRCDDGDYQLSVYQDGNWSEWSECHNRCDNGDLNVIKDVCGLNGRGYNFLTCKDGLWERGDECYDVDECVDGAKMTDENGDELTCSGGYFYQVSESEGE